MVKRGIVRGLLVIGATVSAVGLGQVSASADVGSGAEYGTHVEMCAQEMGFSGTHNPGTHLGYAGWADHDMHCAH